jgi:hypothetical protein
MKAARAAAGTSRRVFGGEVARASSLDNQPSLHTGLTGDFSGVRVDGLDNSIDSRSIARPTEDERAMYDMPLDMSANPRREPALLDEGTWNMMHQVQRCAYEWDRFASEVSVPNRNLAVATAIADARSGHDDASTAAREMGRIASRYRLVWEEERRRLTTDARDAAMHGLTESTTDAYQLAVTLIDAMVVAIRKVHTLADEVLADLNLGGSWDQARLAMGGVEARVETTLRAVSNKIRDNERMVQATYDDRFGVMAIDGGGSGAVSVPPHGARLTRSAWSGVSPTITVGIGALVTLIASALA